MVDLSSLFIARPTNVKSHFYLPTRLVVFICNNNFPPFLSHIPICVSLYLDVDGHVAAVAGADDLLLDNKRKRKVEYKIRITRGSRSGIPIII